MRLRFAPRARVDIGYIHQYIASHNTGAATAVVRQIRSTSQLLARYPGLGRETNIPGARVFPTARYPYLIYYRLIADEVVIVHVRDGRRDAPEGKEL